MSTEETTATNPGFAARVKSALGLSATTVACGLAAAIALWVWYSGEDEVATAAPVVEVEQAQAPAPTVEEQIAQGVRAAEAKRPAKAQKAPALPKPPTPAPVEAPASAQTVENPVAPVWGTTDLDRDIENFTPTSAFKGETR